MPWLVGIAGTGKSLVQDIIGEMFAVASTGSLTGNQEQTFGLDGKYNCHILLGRDLPHKMSMVLSQELLQSMVSGERVSIPRKNQMALDLKWTVPILFASNTLPDYADNNGQIVRRLVPFMFKSPVASPDPTLFSSIINTELPAIISKVMDAYIEAVKEHGSSGFWTWCPPEILAAQKEVGVATSLVRRFLALGPKDDEAIVREDNHLRYVVYLRWGDNVATSMKVLKAAFMAYKKAHHKVSMSTEVINKSSLEIAGLKVEERHTCRTCGRQDTSKRCCAEYSYLTQKKLTSAVGVFLERIPYDDVCQCEEGEEGEDDFDIIV